MLDEPDGDQRLQRDAEGCEIDLDPVAAHGAERLKPAQPQGDGRLGDADLGGQGGPGRACVAGEGSQEGSVDAVKFGLLGHGGASNESGCRTP
ncbi:hypothetical protein GCM10009761_08570 [Agromyces terreus]